LKAEALLLALFTMQAGVPSPSPPVSPPAEGAPSLSSTPAGEAPTIPEGEDRLRQVRERRETLSRELERLRGEERSLLGDVDRLELEVRLRGEELHEIRGQSDLEGALVREPPGLGQFAGRERWPIVELREIEIVADRGIAAAK